MANNQNPTMGQPLGNVPMGAGRGLGLANQFFQGPGGVAGQQQPLPPAAMANLQAQLAGMRGQNPQGWAQGSAGPSMDALLGAGGAPGLGQQQAKLGQMAAGAPGQGPGGQKAGGGAGMPPQMQQQIARLPGGPRPGAPRRPPAARGAQRRPGPLGR